MHFICTKYYNWDDIAIKNGHSDCAKFLQLRIVPKTSTPLSSRIEVFSEKLVSQGMNFFVYQSRWNIKYVYIVSF